MTNYFQILELPARYALEPAVLERRYRELSQRWHPDRHGHASPAERAEVLRRATDLNEAYRALRSDDGRAEHLLRLHGIDVGAEAPDRRVPADPTFLMQILELREALQEAQAAGDHARIRLLEKDVRERVQVVRAQVAAGFDRLEEGDQAALLPLSKAVTSLRFYRRFHEEIEAYEEAQADAAGRLV